MTIIHTACVEGKTLSNHRSAEGAAKAVIADLRERLQRGDSTQITDDEERLIIDTLVDQGLVDFNIGKDMTLCGIPEERMTRLAFLLNRRFTVTETPLLD